MPLGIVSDDQFKTELENNSVEHIRQRPPENSTIITSDSLPIVEKLPSVGRTPEVSNIPQSLRKILGEEVVTNGLASAKQLANSLGGVSQPTLSTYASGHVSPHGTNPQDEDMFQYVNHRKTKLTKKALNKLNLALTLIDEEKLLGCDAKELSTVAKDMAQVAKHMEPDKREDEKSEPVQFHFYAPQVRQENHYEVVTAKDNY